jgi:hypothetical protein
MARISFDWVGLHCSALACIELHCVALVASAWQWLALHWLALKCIGLHWIGSLHCTGLHCFAFVCIGLHWLALECLAMLCIGLHGIGLYGLDCTVLHWIKSYTPPPPLPHTTSAKQSTAMKSTATHSKASSNIIGCMIESLGLDFRV